MRATIRQVAEHAQVSPKTVSNVLLGRDSIVAPATRERVLRAVQELNYIPVQPPTAQNRQVETHTIGLVFEHPDITHYDLDLFTYEGISERARKHGYDLLTLLRTDSGRILGNQETRFMDRRSDGFIFTISASSVKGQWAAALEVLAKNKVPTVVCYCRDAPEGIAWVDTDNAHAMQQAVTCLTKQGHTRIAYLAGPPSNYHNIDRQASWKKAMQGAGLYASDSFIVPGNTEDWKIDTLSVGTIFELDVTAVVCFNDTLALELWDAAEERGLKVPRDLSLVGIDNRPDGVLRGLTTVAHSFSAVGRLAVDAWVELSQGGNFEDCCKYAPVELVERASVAPWPTHKSVHETRQIGSKPRVSLAKANLSHRSVSGGRR
jgi:DNA-binding LacI/PurR family transcriptional regulator